MQKDLHLFACPCCGKQIELDVRSGKARAAVPGEGQGQDLDALLQQQRRDGERLGRAFDTARDSQHRQHERLDDLLKQAKDDARKKPDEQVRRPFDLD